MSDLAKVVHELPSRTQAYGLRDTRGINGPELQHERAADSRRGSWPPSAASKARKGKPPGTDEDQAGTFRLHDTE